MHIDETLNWNTHIDQCCGFCHKFQPFCKKFLTHDALRQFVFNCACLWWCNNLIYWVSRVSVLALRISSWWPRRLREEATSRGICLITLCVTLTSLVKSVLCLMRRRSLAIPRWMTSLFKASISRTVSLASWCVFAKRKSLSLPIMRRCFCSAECLLRIVRFLWWSDDVNDPPEDFQMLVHIFGAKSSP